MSGPELAIACRPMVAADLDACMALKALAGWNQQRRDWELFLGFHPEGCFVACEGERLVGTATSIDYDGRFSWVGMVLVHPDRRRRGIGTLLMEAVLGALARCETVKLDATPAGREVYLQLGFADEYELARLIAPHAEWGPPSPPSAALVPAQAADLAEIAALDEPAFGVRRDRVLRAWYERAPESAFVLRRAGRIAGFAMGRPGAHFAQIGPVIADRDEDAQALAQAAGRSLGNGPIGIDSPARHHALRSWLEDRGFAFQRPLVRMFRGPNRYPGQPERQWAILGPEVG